MARQGSGGTVGHDKKICGLGWGWEGEARSILWQQVVAVDTTSQQRQDEGSTDYSKLIFQKLLRHVHIGMTLAV